MKLTLDIPKSSDHPLVQLTISTPKGSQKTTMDDRHRTFEYQVAKGVSANDVRVVAEFCNGRGEPDPKAAPIILKEAKAKPEPKTEPKPEPEPEPEAPKTTPPTNDK